MDQFPEMPLVPVGRRATPLEVFEADEIRKQRKARGNGLRRRKERAPVSFRERAEHWGFLLPLPQGGTRLS